MVLPSWCERELDCQPLLNVNRVHAHVWSLNIDTSVNVYVFISNYMCVYMFVQGLRACMW